MAGIAAEVGQTNRGMPPLTPISTAACAPYALPPDISLPEDPFYVIYTSVSFSGSKKRKTNA